MESTVMVTVVVVPAFRRHTQARLKSGPTLVLMLVAWLLAQATGAAQERPTLTVTVVDPSGGLLVGARVRVLPERGDASEADTGQDGTAHIPLSEAGRVRLRVEAPGFEPSTDDLRVRRDTRRTVTLSLAKVLETVTVGRDPQARASDPRSDAFATILGAAEIQELPDDPDEMERVLREMAGPGSVLRVNGFRGGRLPPKEQIAQIRFHRNMFAADVHEPGFLGVDIITKPGFDTWSGSAGSGIRNDALNARNALAPRKVDERYTRGAFTASGPLWKKHTSLALSLDGTNTFDTATLVGTTLAGAFARAVGRPGTSLNGSARLEHALTSSHQARIEVQRTHTSQRNLGIGNFDLESRAYSQQQNDTVVRGSLAGPLRKSGYSEWRLSYRDRSTAVASVVQAPTVVVMNAFTDGGAQRDGQSTSRQFDLAQDIDIARKRHALRTGYLLEAGRSRTDERRNLLGTFTFSDLAAYRTGQPLTFSRTTGEASAAVTQVQVGSYVQDDVRITPRLTLSAGLRQEWQHGIGGVNLGPRGGLAWSPFRSGRTTVRAGAGIFFDWFEAADRLRAEQLDGRHQQVDTVLLPPYPDGSSVGGSRLTNGRVVIGQLAQPTLKEVSAGIEQTAGWARLSLMAFHRRGSQELRGVDINAPSGGVRPSPSAGPVTDIRSTARSGVDGVSLNLNIVQPERRLFLALNYSVGRGWNETDSPFGVAADPARPDAERGPAPTDARHRAMGFASMPLGGGLTAGVSFSARSALPFDILTGNDGNRDGLVIDRPDGVGRNAGRGRASADVSVRLAWRRGFGAPATARPGGPQVRIVRGGSDGNPLADMPGGDRARRLVVEAYAQLFNATNRSNATAFGTVLSSPYFGQPVAMAPPRRVELGVRLSF